MMLSIDLLENFPHFSEKKYCDAFVGYQCFVQVKYPIFIPLLWRGKAPRPT